MKPFGLISTLAAAALSSSAHAAIAYVDATPGAGGNTTLVGGATWSPLTGGDQGVAGDGVWAQRAFGNSATIYQSAANGQIDDAQRLQTTVSGLPEDTYDVYAYMWFVGGWGMRASLTDDTTIPLFLGAAPPTVIQFYDGADATVLSSALATNPFDSEVMVAEGNRRLLQIHLGQTTGTSFSVFIDDPGQGTTERSWYDGVGYSVVPEPSGSALLLGSFGLLALRRRRSS